MMLYATSVVDSPAESAVWRMFVLQVTSRKRCLTNIMNFMYDFMNEQPFVSLVIKCVNKDFNNEADTNIYYHYRHFFLFLYEETFQGIVIICLL